MDVDGWKQHCPKRVWCPAGVYGALGTPARGNTPGGRNYAMGWTDNNGNLWLFGGQGADASSPNEGILNDLSEFAPSTSQ